MPPNASLRTTRWAWARLVVTALVLVTTAACSDQGADQGAVTTTPRPLPVGEVELAPIVPVDDSPFCRTMLSLDDDEDPPSLATLTAAYVDLLDDVPAAIRAEFEIVLAGLVAEADAPGAPTALEREEATESLAEFVAMRCRGTQVNPLPPPTAPE